MTYTVVRTRTLLYLEIVVSRKMREGWKPHGGVSLQHDWYLQAMVKDEKDREVQSAQAEGSQGRTGVENEAA